MNRRGFLGQALVGFAGAMMIKSLGQTALEIPEEMSHIYEVTAVDTVRSTVSYEQVYSSNCVAALKELYDRDCLDSLRYQTVSWRPRRRKKRWIG